MKKIEVLDRAAQQGKTFEEMDLVPSFYRAYQESCEKGYDLPNFGIMNEIWEQDIEHILQNCRTYGITEFTISNDASGTIRTLKGFLDNGCRFAGMVELGKKKEPAIHIMM